MTSAQVTAIEAFVFTLQTRIDAYYNKHYKNLISPVVSATYGKKYAKIIRKERSGSQTFVHCFIEISTGDIYKAATYNAPAKHVRGNINTPDVGMSAVSENGANYLR